MNEEDIDTAVAALAAEIHEAWEFQYDECDHGTYQGGHLNGESYAMCHLTAKRIIRRRAAAEQQTRSYIERKTSDYTHNYDSGGKVRFELKEPTYEGEQRSRLMSWLFPIRCRYCRVRQGSFDAMRECVTTSMIATEHSWEKP